MISVPRDTVMDIASLIVKVYQFLNTSFLILALALKILIAILTNAIVYTVTVMWHAIELMDAIVVQTVTVILTIVSLEHVCQIVLKKMELCLKDASVLAMENALQTFVM